MNLVNNELKSSAGASATVTVTGGTVAVSAGTPPTRTIPFYACGGCGINIGANIAKLQSTMDQSAKVHHAVAEIHYIDGSTQNYGSIPEYDKNNGNVYVMRRKDASVDLLHNPDGEELQGGGGDRAFMGTIAVHTAEEVLAKWPASDEMNVVAMSAAGSVGSTVGAQIFHQLLKAGKPVVVILVGVNASTLRAANTSKTLMTLMQFQANAQHSGAVKYLVNSGISRQSEAETDAEIVQFWIALSNVLAGTAQRLDARDIRNWIHYNEVLRTESQLLLVDAHVTGESLAKATDATSVIGVQKEQSVSAQADAVLNKVLYTKIGLVSDTSPFTEVYLSAHPLSNALLREIDTNLTTAVASVAASSTLQQQQASLINRFAKAGDNNLGVL